MTVLYNYVHVYVHVDVHQGMLETLVPKNRDAVVMLLRKKHKGQVKFTIHTVHIVRMYVLCCMESVCQRETGGEGEREREGGREGGREGRRGRKRETDRQKQTDRNRVRETDKETEREREG